MISGDKLSGVLLVLASLLPVDALSRTGGHINWSGSLSGYNGTGKAYVTLLTPAQRRSNAMISANNNWVSETPDTYDFDHQCLSWGGNVMIDAKYKVRGRDEEVAITHNFPAYFFFQNAHINSFRVEQSMDNVSIENVDSSGLYLLNFCSENKHVNIYREIKVGENHWDIRITGDVPFKSQCALSVSSSVDVGDISYSELTQASEGLLYKNQKSIPVAWVCTGSGVRAKLSVSVNKWAQNCLVSDNDALHFCLFQKDGVTPIALPHGQKVIDVTTDYGSTELVVIPRAGSKPQPGTTQAVMTLKIEPQ